MTRARRWIAGLAALVSLVAVGAVGRGLLLSSASVSDVERLTVNRLTAVTVDIEATEGTARLSFDGMAPGDRATASLTLLNSGTAALRYALVLEGAPPAMAEHLRVDVWEPNPDCGDGRAGPPAGATTLAANQAVSGSGATAIFGDPASGLQPTDRTIDVGGSDRVCVSVRVELSAPNSIQGQPATGVLTAVAEHDVEPA